MKRIKLILFLIAFFAFGCHPANTPHCEYDIIYTDECPCASNMSRWYDMCRYKNTEEFGFRGGGHFHDCMDDYPVIIPKRDKTDEFILLQKNGLMRVTHVIRRTEEWIYSEV